jgi:hypothetical protein
MLNSAPYEWTIEQLLRHAKEGPSCQKPDGGYEPARPFGDFSLRSRFRLAWMVFNGKADALCWPLQQPRAY